MSGPAGTQDVFDAVVVVHVLTAVAGFGSVALSGVYGYSTPTPDDPEALEEAGRWLSRPNRAVWAVPVVPVLGVVALLVQPHGRGPAQLWAGLALAVWAVAALAVFRLARPAETSLRALLAAAGTGGAAPAGDGAGPGPGDAAPVGVGIDPGAWAGAARALARGAAVSDVAAAAALLLMVFQPRG